MSKFKKNIISSLIFFALGIILLFVIPSNISDVKLSAIGPRSFPYFIAISMIILSTILMISTFLNEKKNSTITNKNTDVVEEMKEDKRDTRRVIIFLVLIFIYIILFEKVGYFISTFLLSTLILILFKTKNVWSYIIVYLVAIGIYLGFTKLLFVMLP